MINEAKTTHDELRSRVVRKYQQDGYQVFVEPRIPELPFDLGHYRPDLLAMKSENDGYIIEIKSKSAYTSVDRYREIAETVSQHDGWRFVLITGDDVSQTMSEQKLSRELLSWDEIMRRKERGEKLIELGEFEGAFLVLWGALEASMRRQAEAITLPIEHFPSLSLIKHLYSQGELSIDQFDKTMKLCATRNQVAHGFQTEDLDSLIVEMKGLVSEIVELWH